MIARVQVSGMQKLAPGIILCATVAMAASFLTAHYGAPVMLFALLLGMAFNSIDTSGTLQPGIAFSAKSLLRLGVALLGARVTLGNMVDLGIVPFMLAVCGVMLSMGVGLVLCRLMGRKSAFGLLTGGAVGICGASAALALSSVLPRGQDGISERDTIFTVVSVTALSTVAMVVYPIVAQVLHFDDTQAGMFIGATVHDVAQVVGAGFSISETAGNTATIAKLIRVAMLVPVIAIITVALRRRQEAGGGAPARFPEFLLGFIALMVVNSMGLIPPAVTDLISDASRWLLIVAIAGLGTKTNLGELREIGPTAAVIIVAETVAIAALALIVLAFCR
jgi:uncharacterized integral membrane protein (TIGR00698 family)